MKITIIVAKSNNNVIGKDNALLWHLSADLKNFKRLTSGHCIIMGRKTYQSIGRALPNRTNIVITRNRNFEAEACVIKHTLEAALEFAESNGEKEVFIIGGAEIYKQSLDKTQKIHLTQVDVEIEGDSFFSVLNMDKWTCIQKKTHLSDSKNEYNYTFETYKKRF